MKGALTYFERGHIRGQEIVFLVDWFNVQSGLIGIENHTVLLRWPLFLEIKLCNK